VDGARHVRIYGDEIAIRGSVHTIGGLSAHADRDDLDAWLEMTRPARIHLVHGDPDVLASYASHLRSTGRDAEPVPDRQTISL